jgi:nucleoside diphosphate kinase
MRQRQIEERDLKMIDVSEGQHRVVTALRPSTAQINTIRKQLSIGVGETRPLIVLIGKDSGEKARCHDAIDLEKWFALIDAMPMRRAEIRDQTKSR